MASEEIDETTRRIEARACEHAADGTEVELCIRGPHAKDLIRYALRAALRVVGNGVPTPKIAVQSASGIVGKSAPISELLRLVERVGPTSATVLITGENGTGKELVAKALHSLSPRKAKRFVAVNCAAIPSELLESEFFGHRRGAFTGAIADKPGLFEVADGGTFFMDEIGDMPTTLQVKLLRVLQEGTFTPVGGTETRRANVRIVAATNQDLVAMVKAGTFREDLFYRLNVVALKVPALRERLEDIPLLTQYFLDRLASKHGKKKRVSEQVLRRWMRHTWPGNVRELENEIEKLWVLSGDDEVIGVELFDDDIALAMRSTPPAPDVAAKPVDTVTPEPSGIFLPDAIESLERRMIAAALERCGGNKTRAAEELGISRRNLIRKVQAYGFAVGDGDLDD